MNRLIKKFNIRGIHWPGATRINFFELSKKILQKLPFLVIFGTVWASIIVPLVIHSNYFWFILRLWTNSGQFNDFFHLNTLAIFVIVIGLVWWSGLIWYYGFNGLIIVLFQGIYLIFAFMIFGFLDFQLNNWVKITPETGVDNPLVLNHLRTFLNITANNPTAFLLNATLPFGLMRFFFTLPGLMLLINTYWNLRFFRLIKQQLTQKLTLWQAFKRSFSAQVKVLWCYLILTLGMVIVYYVCYFTLADNLLKSSRVAAKTLQLSEQEIQHMSFLQHNMQLLLPLIIRLFAILLLAFAINILYFTVFCLIWFVTFPIQAKRILLSDTQLVDSFQVRVMYDGSRLSKWLKKLKISQWLQTKTPHSSKMKRFYFWRNRWFLNEHVQVGFLIALGLGFALGQLFNSQILFLPPQTEATQEDFSLFRKTLERLLLIDYLLPLLGWMLLFTFFGFIFRFGILVGLTAFGKLLGNLVILIAVGFLFQNLNFILLFLLFAIIWEIWMVYQAAWETLRGYQNLLTIRQTKWATYQQILINRRHNQHYDLSFRIWTWIIIIVTSQFLFMSVNIIDGNPILKIFNNLFAWWGVVAIFIYYQILSPYLMKYTEKMLIFSKFYQIKWYYNWRKAQFKNYRKGNVREQIIAEIND